MLLINILQLFMPNWQSGPADRAVSSLTDEAMLLQYMQKMVWHRLAEISKAFTGWHMLLQNLHI